MPLTSRILFGFVTAICFVSLAVVSASVRLDEDDAEFRTVTPGNNPTATLSHVLAVNKNEVVFVPVEGKDFADPNMRFACSYYFKEVGKDEVVWTVQNSSKAVRTDGNERALLQIKPDATSKTPDGDGGTINGPIGKGTIVIQGKSTTAPSTVVGEARIRVWFKG